MGSSPLIDSEEEVGKAEVEVDSQDSIPLGEAGHMAAGGAVAGHSSSQGGGTPVEGEAGHTPVEGEAGRTPVEGEAGRTPVEGEAGRTPVEGRSVGAGGVRRDKVGSLI